MDISLEEMKWQMKVKDSKIEELLKAIEASQQPTQDQGENHIITRSNDPLHEVSKQPLN